MEIKELYQAIEVKFSELGRQVGEIVRRLEGVESVLKSTAEKVVNIKECLDLDRRQATMLDSQHETLDLLKVDIGEMSRDVDKLKDDVTRIKDNMN